MEPVNGFIKYTRAAEAGFSSNNSSSNHGAAAGEGGGGFLSPMSLAGVTGGADGMVPGREGERLTGLYTLASPQ